MGSFQKTLSVILIWLMVVQTVRGAHAEVTGQIVSLKRADEAREVPPLPAPLPPLNEAVKLPSVEIAALAEKSAFDETQIRTRTEGLNRENKARELAYKAAAKKGEKEIRTKRAGTGKAQGAE